MCCANMGLRPRIREAAGESLWTVGSVPITTLNTTLGEGDLNMVRLLWYLLLHTVSSNGLVHQHQLMPIGPKSIPALFVLSMRLKKSSQMIKKKSLWWLGSSLSMWNEKRYERSRPQYF
jgi:hypothetical protein